MIFTKKYFLIFIAFFSLNFLGKTNPQLLYKSNLLSVKESNRYINITTLLYGKVRVDKTTKEGYIVSTIINHTAFKRLKNINQYGPSQYLECARKILYKNPLTQKYTRYEHSICVYVILRRHVKDYKERIAGLIHDIAHPPFSHAGDLFVEYLTGKDHDQRIEDFLEEVGLAQTLKDEDINLQSVIFNKKQKNLIAVKRPKPFLSADRIEYTLTGAFLCGALKDVGYVVSKLQFNNEWYFETLTAAQSFGKASIYMTKYYTGVAWNTVLGRIILEILKEVCPLTSGSSKQRLMSPNNIHDMLHQWGDKDLWRFLIKLKPLNTQINKLMNAIRRMNNKNNHHNLFCLAEEPCTKENSTETHHSPAPSRICDPCVKENGQYKFLSQIDDEFEQEKAGIEYLLKTRYIEFVDAYLALLFKNTPIQGY